MKHRIDLVAMLALVLASTWPVEMARVYELRPAAPFELVYADGEKLRIMRECKGTYSCWDAECKRPEKQ